MQAIRVERIIDAIIVLLALEMAVLALYRRQRREGMPLREMLAFCGAGFAMLIALRILAGGGTFIAFGAAMLASLVLHVIHISQRWTHSTRD